MLRYLLILFITLPCFNSYAQTDNGLFELYQNYTPYQVKQTIRPVKNISVIEYNERSLRKYDSISVEHYPSGNISSKSYYSRYSTELNYVYEYLDNNKEQISKIYWYNAYHKSILKYSYTYNKQGMETAILYDNYGVEERKYSYKYDEKGNQVEFIGTYHNNPDLDFSYEYDQRGRKIKEIHKGRGDIIFFMYDIKGNKVQDIYQSNNGAEIEKVLLYEYDSAHNLIETKVALGGGNLRKDRNVFNSLSQKICTIQYDAEGFTDQKMLYQYDRDNNLAEETTMRPGMQGFFVFDKNGNEDRLLRRTKGNFPDDHHPVDEIRTVVTDSIGRLVKEAWKYRYTSYLYNSTCADKLAQTWSYGKDDFLYNKTSFEYDSKCLLRSKTTINFYEKLDYGPDKRPDTIQTFFTYNSSGNIIEEKCIRPSHELLYQINIKYNKKIISEVILIDNSRHKSSLYNFNNKAELSSLKIFIDNKLAEDNFYSYEYDERGNWIKRICDDKINEKKVSIIERSMGE